MRMHIISGGMLTVVVLINELLLVDGLAADLALLENADALLGELPLYLLNHKVLVRMRLDEDEGGVHRGRAEWRARGWSRAAEPEAVVG